MNYFYNEKKNDMDFCHINCVEFEVLVVLQSSEASGMWTWATSKKAGLLVTTWAWQASSGFGVCVEIES